MSDLGQHRRFLLLNLAGGLAVLGSYAWGFLARPDDVDRLWGGVPASIQTLYTANMLLAAAGYFLFTWFFLTRVDRQTRLVGGLRFGAIEGLYAAVLIGSALWMPLTFRMLDLPSAPLWWLIRLDLALVGLASLALLAVLLLSDLDRSGWLYPAAVLGLAAFCLQTAVLDATVWPIFFR